MCVCFLNMLLYTSSGTDDYTEKINSILVQSMPWCRATTIIPCTLSFLILILKLQFPVFLTVFLPLLLNMDFSHPI